jgi:hypothetical protein
VTSTRTLNRQSRLSIQANFSFLSSFFRCFHSSVSLCEVFWF